MLLSIVRFLTRSTSSGGRRFRSALCGALLCLATAPSSVPAQYRFDHWTADTGLPHNSIRGIWQTRDGYIWLTTVDGVARFDGVRFRVFNKANTPELTTNKFAYLALWEDRRGALWMGTLDGGVICYRDGRFFALTTEDGLPSNHVVRIDEDEEGVVWIFTEGGLAQWKDGRLIRIAPAPGSPFNDCLNDPREYLGVDAHLFGFWRINSSGSSGWQRFAYGRWTALPLPPHLTDPAKIRAYYMYEDARRNLWFGLKDREGEAYLVKDGRLSILRNMHPANRSYICHQDRQGRIWSGSHGGLNGFWKDGRFTPLPELVTSNVFKALEDREGGLWIATFFEGLYRFREQFITFHRPAGGSDYKTAKTAGAMLEDSRGNVWLRSAALARFKDGRFTNYYRSGRTQKAWDWGNVVSALYEDQDGSIWVGTWDGVTRFRDGRLFEERLLSEQIKGRVHAIRRDRAGNLWFGMESGGGLYRLRDGSLTHYTTQDGLAGATVSVILEDRAGRLWFGTNRGLSRFTGTGFETPNVAEELSFTAVNALHEDVDGVIWIGTYDRGLYRLDADQERIKLTRYTTKQGLHSDRVDLILEDDTGFVWMACNLGLIRVRKQELEDFAGGRISSVTSTWFGKADGLINEENRAFAEPVGHGFKARDGKLWFSTREGIAVVDPKAVPFNPNLPPVVIEECVVDRRPAEFQNDLRISPGQENLEIQYTALSLVKSEQVSFRYKMEGLDRDWVEAGVRRAAYYSHIPPGDYVFKVIAANSDGVWNLTGQSLQVIVLAPFYRRLWFLLLLSIVILGLAAGVVRLRFNQLRKARAVQEQFSRQLIESQEAERKRIAAELHDSLSQSLVIIKNRALLGLQKPGDQARTIGQLEEIVEATGSAIDEVKEIAYALRPFHLDRLGLAQAIEVMLERIAETSGIHFTSHFDALDGLFSPEVEINVYRMVQECVSNIVKHAQATEGKVSIEKDVGKRNAHAVIIRIADNGRGFTPGASNNVGNAGHTGSLLKRGDELRRKGFGLSGLAERCRIIGGQMTVDSAPGRGTTITIRIYKSSHRGTETQSR